MSNLDPRIGVLNSGKFYCYPNGYANPEFVGSLEEVERVLGLDPSPSVVIKPKAMRWYEVTITPTMTTYSGTWTGGPYTVDVPAHTASEAVSRARQARNAEEGKHGTPATYRARLKRD